MPPASVFKTSHTAFPRFKTREEQGQACPHVLLYPVYSFTRVSVIGCLPLGSVIVR